MEPLARDQAFWYLLSAVGFIIVLRLVRHVRDLDRYRYLTLVAAIALLASPLVPHLGTTVNGARLWIDVGPLSLQPVEIAKILLVFSLRPTSRRIANCFRRLRNVWGRSESSHQKFSYRFWSRGVSRWRS